MTDSRFLADEVAKLLKKGISYRIAVATVLQSNGISDNWHEYMSEIGKILSKRRSRKSTVSHRRRKESDTMEENSFSSLSLEEMIREAEEMALQRRDHLVDDL